MLKAEGNEILTRVGPGSLTENLLRRYWTPASLSAEIPEPGSPPVRVRLRTPPSATRSAWTSDR